MADSTPPVPMPMPGAPRFRRGYPGPRGLRPPQIERALDGDAKTTVGRYDPAASEFSRGTDVFYVNGIRTTFHEETLNAAQYAQTIHDAVHLIHAATNGTAADLVTTAEEKAGMAHNPPEKAVASAVLDRLHGTRLEGPVHFMAHSRGALIVQRGLEQVESELHHRHFSPAQIRDVLSGVSVETAGGASLGMPPGVRCVNYVDPHDSVANVFGQGQPSLKDVAVIDAAAGASHVLPGGSLADAGVHTYLALKPAITHPNGPVIAVPVQTAPPGSGPLGDLLANHDIMHYLAYRQPFEHAYATWRHAHPRADAAPAHEPATHAAARASELAYASALAAGVRSPQLGGDVQRAVDMLAENGGPRLPNVAQVRPSSSQLSIGTFVALDERTVTQHIGRGIYEISDVPRDLAGQTPPLGHAVERTASGIIRDPAPARGSGRELG